MTASVAASPPVATLGVATVGLGVGEQHAAAYAKLPHCQLRWVCDLDAARARAVAARLGNVPVAAGYDTILGDPYVGLVSIASYDDAHCEQVVAALEAGKHVFVEKPLCRSHAELRTVRDAWRRSSGRQIGSNLVLRAAPLYRWLRETIASGALGEVYAVDGDYLYGRLHKITDGWRRDVENYSVVQGGGVHLADLILWLTGQRPDSVTAVGNRICTERTPFRYKDFVAATFTFPSGLVGRITANFGCVHRHQHVLRVFGTKGSFIYDDAGARLHVSRDPAEAPRRIDLSPLPGGKGDLIPAFVAAVVDGADGTRDTQHEFDVISVCLAADAAVAAGRAVPVEYV